jgi:hypothetical protein
MECCYAECNLCVANKPIMLSVIVINVFEYFMAVTYIHSE